MGVFQCLRIVDEGLVLGGKARGVSGICAARPELQDVDQSLFRGCPREGNGVLQLYAVSSGRDLRRLDIGGAVKLIAIQHFEGFFGADQNLNGEILAAGLLDLPAAHQREADAVFQAAAKLVGAEVQQGGEHPARCLEPVCYVDGDHVKAQGLQNLRLLSKIGGDLLQHLPGELLAGFGLTGTSD